MSNMKPSEIAEFVDWKAEWERTCDLRISDRQKSQEIINERDKWIVELIQDRDTANAKLKIATEALELAHTSRVFLPPHVEAEVKSALDRIKEV